jgi:hypothetical protein
VYRRDSIDATHYPVFHQMEGVRIYAPADWEAAGLDATAFCERELKASLEVRVVCRAACVAAAACAAVLCAVRCALHAVCCVLCAACCVLHAVCCVLCAVRCVPCAVCCAVLRVSELLRLVVCVGTLRKRGSHKLATATTAGVTPLKTQQRMSAEFLNGVTPAVVSAARRCDRRLCATPPARTHCVALHQQW